MRASNRNWLGVVCLMLVLTFLSARLVSSIPPFFDPEPIQYMNLTQDIPFNYDVNASSPDNSTPITYTHDAYSTEPPWTNFYMSSITGLINFTATNADVGNHNVTLIISDSKTPIAQKALATIIFTVINVNDPPNIYNFTPSSQVLSINESDSENFTFNYNASDPDQPYGDYLGTSWYLDGNSISHEVIYEFVPGYCGASNRNLTLIVNDSSNLQDSVAWNITVINVNRVPEFNWSTPLPNITWEEDTILPNNFSLDNYFGDNDTRECGDADLIYSTIGNHSIIVNISSGPGHNVSFSAPHNWYGNETIRFSASDGYNTTFSNYIVLNITNTADEPIIQNISNKTLYAMAPFYFWVNASSPDGLGLTYYDNTTLFDIDSVTGVIYFTPAQDTLGNFSIMINVSDGIYNVFTIFNMEIINNSQPYIYPIPDRSGEQNSEFTFVVDGFDLDGDNIIYWTNYSRLGSPTVLNSTASRFTFTPNQDDATIGNISILVRANDTKGASYTVTFNLSINDTNNPPVLGPIASQIIIKVNHTYNIQVNATDDDNDTLTFSHDASPGSFPNFQMSPGGLITIAANASDLGNHTINISVWDNTMSNLSDYAYVTFIVRNNTAPTILPLGVINVTEDEYLMLQINATDPDGDPLVFATNFTFNISASGLFSFTPNQSMVGIHNISINVTDDDGAAGTQTFLLNVMDINDPPYFDPALESYPIWADITEGDLIEIYVNATDDENDDLLFNRTFISGATIFGINKISVNRALINFTPTQGMVGNYSVNISVSDGQYTVDVIINFTVRERNDPPSILTIYPYGAPISATTVFDWRPKTDFPANFTDINTTENSSLLFNHTSSDPENATLTYSWYLDGLSVSAQQYLNYRWGFNSSGMHNVTLRVNDSDYSDQMEWRVNVANVNRAPVFGMKTHSTLSDFLAGTYSQINVTSEGIRLVPNGSEYLSAGSYVSAVIDTDLDSRLEDVIWSGSFPENTSGMISTSTSINSGSGWSAWSGAVTINESGRNAINSTSRRYVRYMANLSTSTSTATPVIRDVSISYIIDNETQIESYYTIENSSSSFWIDLDEFFNDPDGDSLNYTYTNTDTSVLELWIESWNGNHVGIRSLSEGTAYVTFTGTDPSGMNTTSNTVTLTFTTDPNQGSGGSSSSTSNSIVVRTRIQEVQRDVDKYININLVVPEAVTTYQNSTIVSPIKLVNSGKKDLKDITLTAETNATGVTLEFTKSEFTGLKIGEETKTNLIITSGELLGTYDVTVTAHVKDPEFSDSAKIILSTLEKGEMNKTQLNTKITFTRDLLLANPECLELNEMLKQAEVEINKSNFAKANDLIEDSIRGCQALIASKENLKESPSLLQRLFERIFGLTSKKQVTIYSAIIIGVFLTLTASLVIERVRNKNTNKRKTGKNR